MPLSEQRRSQLDGIVQQMSQNKESDSYIQGVVNDFKTKYGNESTITPPKSLLSRAAIATSPFGKPEGYSSSLNNKVNQFNEAVNQPTGNGLLDAGTGFLKGMGKSFLETAARGITSSPFMGSFTKALPEKVNLPFFGDTQIKYSTKDPLATLGQVGSDVLNVAGGPGEKMGQQVAANAAKKSVLPGIASWLTNVPKQDFKTVMEAGKPAMETAVKTLEEPSSIAEFGKSLHTAAQTLRKGAMDAWASSQKKILANSDSVIKAASGLPGRLAAILQPEGISIKDGAVNLVGSKFEGDSIAQVALQKAHDILTGGAKDAQTLLNKRSALSNLMDGLPLEARNVKRVVGNLVDHFDSVLDKATGGQAAKMRSEYAASVGPANDVIAALTKGGEFSPDKASAFIRQAMSGVKMDNKELLTLLDKQLGTEFSKQVRQLGAAKAVERLDPVTGGRVKDILASYVISKIPGLAALVSPKFWSEALMKNVESKAAGKGLFKGIGTMALIQLLKGGARSVLPSSTTQSDNSVGGPPLIR